MSDHCRLVCSYILQSRGALVEGNIVDQVRIDDLDCWCWLINKALDRWELLLVHRCSIYVSPLHACLLRLFSLFLSDLLSIEILEMVLKFVYVCLHLVDFPLCFGIFDIAHESFLVSFPVAVYIDRRFFIAIR